jgi:hypothetical protein
MEGKMKYIVKWYAPDGFFGDMECEDSSEAKQLKRELELEGCSVDIEEVL